MLKGGVLIASIVGLDIRSTMDLDTTIRNFPLTEEDIEQAIKTMCSISLDDNVTFELKSIKHIRKDDQYGGYCARLDATYDTIITPFSIDISTGDVVTPAPVEHRLSGLFDKNRIISLWGYNIETVLAEKIETIISRGVFNTRPRDFYDVYVLSTTQQFDEKVFQEALLATSQHRGSQENLQHIKAILHKVTEDLDLQQAWEKYQTVFPYAQNISYKEIMHVLHQMLEA